MENYANKFAFRSRTFGKIVCIERLMGVPDAKKTANVAVVIYFGLKGADR